MLKIPLSRGTSSEQHWIIRSTERRCPVAGHQIEHQEAPATLVEVFRVRMSGKHVLHKGVDVTAAERARSSPPQDCLWCTELSETSLSIA